MVKKQPKMQETTCNEGDLGLKLLKAPRAGEIGEKKKNQCRAYGVKGVESLGSEEPEPGVEWGILTMNPHFKSWTFPIFFPP